MSKGKIYLVGAGPGDYKLITLRAQELIQKADVLVYDRLVNKKILKFRKPDCELIYAGKKPDHHTLFQHEINDVLIEKAMGNRVVVRLKGGDPFIFGRGGEEAEYIREKGLDFEVVPGISSFYSCPAYAGIPVTHRDFSTSVHVITGHEEEGKEDVDFGTLAKLSGTLVFLMGMKNIGNISRRLIEGGKNPQTPAAVIHWGTTSKQKSVRGDLETIEEIVVENGVTNPSVLIIGDVVSLQDKLQWFTAKPLFGKRVLVTRAAGQAGTLAEKIEELGGDAIEFPTIKIGEPDDYAPLDLAIDSLASYQWLVFTSVNGAAGFFNRMKQLKKDIRSLGAVKIFAIGQKTREQVEAFGVLVEGMPEKYNSSEAAKVLEQLLEPGDKILLPTSDLARDEFSEAVRRKGAEITRVTAYRTFANRDGCEDILEALQSGQIDVITFASSSAAENFVKVFGTDVGSAKVYSIGPMTTETAVGLGLNVAVTAENATIDELVKCLLE